MPVFEKTRKKRFLTFPAKDPAEDLVGGEVGNKPPTKITAKWSPRNRNIVGKDGVIQQRPGLTAFGTKDLGSNVVGFYTWTELDGTVHFIANTLTDIWEWSDGNEEWNAEPLTRQQEIDDCEDAWTAKANVTCTADATVYKEGTKSSKCVIAAGFGTGLVGTYDVSSRDITSYGKIRFWLRCESNLAANVLSIVLSETAACGVLDVKLVIDQALTAATWLYFEKDITLTGMNATISVGLYAESDPGAVTVYIDDINVYDDMTADLDGVFSYAWMGDVALMVNGTDDLCLKWDGATRGFEFLTGGDGYNDSYTGHYAKGITEYYGRILLINNWEEGSGTWTQYKRRVRWSNAGTIGTWSSADYLDIYMGEDEIIGFVQWGGDVILFTKGSIARFYYVGPDAIFGSRIMYKGDCLRASRTVVAVDEGVLFLSSDTVYMYQGGAFLRDVGAPIKRRLFNEINMQRIGRSFAIHDRANNRYLLFVPTGTNTTADTLWIYDYRQNAWYPGDVFGAGGTTYVTGAGEYRITSGQTIGEFGDPVGSYAGAIGDYAATIGASSLILGLSDGTTFTVDSTTLNDSSTAIEESYETMDVVGGPEHIGIYKRYQRLMFDGMGAEVEVAFSVDGGEHWQGHKTITMLAGIWGRYPFWVDRSDKQMRFRFRNVTASEQFAIRWWQVHYQPEGID